MSARHWQTAMMALAALASAGSASAQTLAFPDGGAVAGGVLRLGAGDPGGCCAGDTCAGEFQVANTGAEPVGPVTWSGTTLFGPSHYIPVNDVRVTPPSIAELAPGERQAVKVEVAISPAATPGRYRGSFIAKSGGADTTIPMELTVCEPPALEVIDGAGDFRAGRLALPAGEEPCHAATLGATLVVRAVGVERFDDVRPALVGFPPEASAAFSPPAWSMRPDDEREVRMVLTVAAELAAATYRGAVTIRDRDTGAEAVAPVILDRCDAGPSGEIEGPRDIPLPERLTLSHTVSRAGVRIGEVITFRLTVENRGAGRVTDLELEDRLPQGFVYAPGRTALDGERGPEPSGSNPYRWRLGELPAGAVRTLAFQATVSNRVERGEHTARAWARSARSDVGPVDVTVTVSTKTRAPSGVVQGAVVRVTGPGVPGVRVLLDYDREVETDADGRFRFDAVDAGEHLVAVDRRALPPGTALVGDDAQMLRLFAGSRVDARFVVADRPQLGLRLTYVPEESAAGQE